MYCAATVDRLQGAKVVPHVCGRHFAGCKSCPARVREIFCRVQKLSRTCAGDILQGAKAVRTVAEDSLQETKALPSVAEDRSQGAKVVR